MTDQQIIQELLELIDAKMPSEKLDEHETTTVELARQERKMNNKELFEKYANHKKNCKLYRPTKADMDNGRVPTCDCGYDQAVAEIEHQMKAKELFEKAKIGWLKEWEQYEACYIVKADEYDQAIAALPEPKPVTLNTVCSKCDAVFQTTDDQVKLCPKCSCPECGGSEEVLSHRVMVRDGFGPGDYHYEDAMMPCPSCQSIEAKKLVNDMRAKYYNNNYNREERVIKNKDANEILNKLWQAAARIEQLVAENVLLTQEARQSTEAWAREHKACEQLQQEKAEQAEEIAELRNEYKRVEAYFISNARELWHKFVMS